MSRIRDINALEILDSRGNPTVGVKVILESGVSALAMVPSGASTGEREAVELRDNDPGRYHGKGVLGAVAGVNTEIRDLLLGQETADQREIDTKMIDLDGRPNKSRLGANAILGVSLAVAKATAKELKMPLFRYLGNDEARLLPVPCMNIINGGRHADNNVDFQEYMIAPHHATSFRESIRLGMETFHTLKSILRSDGYSTAVGDEGGFAPQLKNNREPIELILRAIEKAGFVPGRDISLCLDPASSEMWKDGRYTYFKSDRHQVTSEQFVETWKQLVEDYPIILLEDGLAENDWEGWQMLTRELGQKIELVGDDIFCTNTQILKRGIELKVANSILIKLNQIGTLTETLDTIKIARENGYNCFISHRSGETEDTTIADLTVAVGAGHIKTGSGCRSERVAKYNRLLWIEHELGDKAEFAGIGAFQHRKRSEEHTSELQSH